MTTCIHCDGEGKHGAADRWVGGSINGGWADSYWPCKHCEGTGVTPESHANNDDVSDGDSLSPLQVGASEAASSPPGASK